ncbi:MAG: transglutaminase [Herpetosiphonaceae bacterium]|nr:MAG: transglutaminase [Herpetosiphonaceae bacterium]
MRSFFPPLKLGAGALTFFLGSLMVYSVVASVIAADWANGLERLVAVMIMGLLIGGVFANLRWLPGWLAHLLSLTLGTIWAVSAIAPLLGPGLPTWKDQASELLLRLIFWIRTLQRGNPGEDYLLFIATMALVTWWLAYITLWLLFRRGWPWVAVLFNGVLILVNLTYAHPKPTGLFFFFLLSALLLLVFETYRWRQLRWRSIGLEEQEFLSLRFIWTGAIVCTTLVIVTALMPTSISSAQVERVWVQVKRPWTAVQSTWDRAFHSIKGPGRPSLATFSRQGVGLGGARVATNEIIMEVQASRAEYWRSNAFDLYTPDEPIKWRNTTGELAQETLGVDSPEEALREIPVGKPMPQIDLDGREPLTQTITIIKDRGDNQLPAATQPLSYSLPVLVEHSFLASANDGAPLPNFSDTSIVFSPTPIRKGMTYTVVSMVSTADKASLRAAGTDYPSWVARYLQIPDTPAMQRVRELAQQITAGANNPYDQAAAIERYLRQMKYNDQISAPPAGRDPVEYFLFELKEGYCDYFASSMVLMMRSLGVPARWVQGYASGDYDEERGVYVVRDVVAHSWPEIYFPGYGWQRFEPTPAGYVTVPERPETSPNGSGEDEGPDGANGEIARTGEQTGERRLDLLELEMQLNEQFGNPEAVEKSTPIELPSEDTQSNLLRRSAPFLLALALVAVLWVILVMVREVRGLSPAAAAYARLSQLARWAGIPQRPTATPSEYAAELSMYFPEQQEPIQRIADAYIRERYSPSAPQIDVRRDMRAIQWPLLRGILRRVAPNEARGRRRR